MAKMNIRDIKIKKRVRQEHGDLANLAASIKRLGLLHDIVVDKKTKELVCGERRLKAAGMISGNGSIDVKLIDFANAKDRHQAEVDENALRLDLSFCEKTALAKSMLSDSQLQQALRETPRKSARDRRYPSDQKREAALEATAKRAGFGSRDSMQRALKVAEEGTAELIRNVEKGEISISRAAAIVKEAPKSKAPKKQQEKTKQAKMKPKAQSRAQVALKHLDQIDKHLAALAGKEKHIEDSWQEWTGTKKEWNAIKLRLGSAHRQITRIQDESKAFLRRKIQ